MEANAPIDHLHIIVLAILVAIADVFRFEVSVSDATAMRVLQGESNLLDDIRRLTLIHAAGLLDSVEDLSSGAVLHDDPDGAAVLVGLVHLADIGVVQLLHEADLPLKGTSHVFVCNGELLYRDLPPWHLPVLGDEDLSEGSGAHLARVQRVPPGDLCVQPLRDESAEVEAPADLGRARGHPPEGHLLLIVHVHLKAKRGAAQRRATLSVGRVVARATRERRA
mmetsp:Transcript_96119/g.277578  ORF Transcript_96119/g.277578 Transcript_96119/m.277578 type:complete len:223 (+) Transcript_96119:1382-2050(+)